MNDMIDFRYIFFYFVISVNIFYYTGITILHQRFQNVLLTITEHNHEQEKKIRLFFNLKCKFLNEMKMKKKMKKTNKKLLESKKFR